MKNLINLLLVSVFLYSCATPQDQKKKVAERNEPIYDAIQAGNLPRLKEEVGNGNLNNQPELHNLLAQFSCNYQTSETNEDIAQYLIDKGSKPEEKTVEHPALVGNQFGSIPLEGPITHTIKGPECLPLLKFYLANMAAKDIAKAANDFKGKDTEELLSWNTKYPENANYMQVYHVHTSPRIYMNLYELAKRNDELCKKGEEANCKAIGNLEKEIAVMRKGVREIAFINACASYAQLQSEEELMKKQLEFGEKTGVASPKTYDFHAQQAQQEQEDIGFYDAVLKFETGVGFNPKLCLQ